MSFLMRKEAGRGQVMSKSLLNPSYFKTDFGTLAHSHQQKTAAHRMALLLCSDITRMRRIVEGCLL